jgi:hypothetical protein
MAVAWPAAACRLAWRAESKAKSCAFSEYNDVVVVDLLLCSAVFMVEANGRRTRMNKWQWQWCLLCAEKVLDELLLRG